MADEETRKADRFLDQFNGPLENAFERWARPEHIEYMHPKERRLVRPSQPQRL